MKSESISQCHKQSQIQICIPACIISSEFFTITPLYSVRVKNPGMDKIVLKTFYIKFKETEQAEISQLTLSVNSLLVTYVGV